MLIELWERLRGYDRWPEAQATVVSGERLRRKYGLPGPRKNTQFSSDLLMWTDQKGKEWYGPFVNQDTSPLFQLLDGELISIRYNPSNPGRFYNREHFQSWMVMIAKAALAIILGGGFIAWRIWEIVAHRGR
jgi:hypothetical protein